MKMEPQQRYEMPATFGPRPIDEITYGDVTVHATRFRTSGEALQALLPAGLIEPTDPIVTVSHHRIADVSFLAGRAYNIVSVTLAALCKTSSGILDGNYGAVLWEDDVYSLVLGRESFGVPKLYANISAMEEGPDGVRRFRCSEYGTVLTSGEFSDVSELSAAEVGEMTSAPGRGGVNFRYKHIPRARGGADLSYLMRGNDFEYAIDRAWSASADHRFHEVNWEQVPVSERVVSGLRTLPVKESLPAMITHGSIRIVQNSGYPLNLIENEISTVGSDV